MKKITTLLLAVLSVIALTLSFSSCKAQAQVKVINIPLTTEEYAYGVKKGDTELLNSLNAFLAQIKGDGTFDAIINKYFGDGTPTAVTSATKGDTSKQLVIATNAAFAPFEYTEGANYYGVDIEIMSLFAKSLDKELVIDNMEFSSVCTSVGQGLCDVAAAGLTINDTRKEILDFSTSYYNASQMLIVASDNTSFDNCTGAAEIEAILKTLPSGTKVGVQTGTTGEYYVAGDEDWGFDGFSNLTVTGYSNGSLAVQDILAGNISYVIIDEAPAKNIVKSINSLN